MPAIILSVRTMTIFVTAFGHPKGRAADRPPVVASEGALTL